MNTAPPIVTSLVVAILVQNLISLAIVSEKRNDLDPRPTALQGTNDVRLPPASYQYHHPMFCVIRFPSFNLVP